MVIIKLRLVGPLFEQCCMKNHLILQTIQNMMVARGWKLLGSGIKTKCVDTATPNEQLANESQKQPLKNFECKIYSSFMDNMWGAYLASMQLMSKYNKEPGFYYLLWTFSVNMHGLVFWKKTKETIT